MKLHELKYTEGSKKNRKRVGRGTGSGYGLTAGRGENGQKSRSGGSIRQGFEGGQNPLYRRLPKRGFSNAPFKKVFTTINVEKFNRFNDGDVVTVEMLLEMGMISKTNDGVKVLGNGQLDKKLTIKAHKFSKTAVAAIEAKGGTVEVL